MDIIDFELAIEIIQAKIGLDLRSAFYISSWNGDTETGFYDDVEIDIVELNKEIDRFSEELKNKSK